jgi:hypothetical protein
MLLVVLSACGAPISPEPAPICPPSAPAASPGNALVLTPFEDGLLRPLLEDLRAGIRPTSDKAVGICRGKRTCEEYLGASPGELAPGDYVVRAELAVPELGSDWSVDYHARCVVKKTGSDGVERTRNDDYDHTWKVSYAGPSKGYRLEPMQAVHSPADGHRDCTWTLVMHHPAGDHEITGSWSVPDAPK